MTSGLEARFAAHVRQLAPDLAARMVAEYPIIRGRRWKWDFAFPAERVAVELQGGVWSRGAHARPRGILRDMEKANAAALAGWRVLFFATDHLERDPAGAIAQLRALLEAEDGR